MTSASSASSSTTSPAPSATACSGYGYAAQPSAWSPAPLSTLASAGEKRGRITAWIKTAISKAEAEERGLVQISRLTMIRNWTCREALYDHAQQAKQSSPELVIVAPGRAALFGVPARRA